MRGWAIWRVSAPAPLQRFSKIGKSSPIMQSVQLRALTGPKHGDTVALGISGGVDSAISAYLLFEQGFKVLPIYMHNWDTRNEDTSRCPSDADFALITRVCKHIGITTSPERVDLSKEYWAQVFDPMVTALAAGRKTPNPDVGCNRYIKFGAFADRYLGGDKPRADWIAMGHYARVERDQNGKTKLLTAIDAAKDQTYYLSMVHQQALSRAIFPVGGFLKSDVKRLAREMGLDELASRKESMGICFIGKRPFAEFIGQYINESPGNLVSLEGRVIGRHNGLFSYTLGQSARIPGKSERWFVADKRVDSNEIVVVPGRTHPALLRKSVTVVSPHWISGSSPREISSGLRVKCKYRYRTDAVLATISCSDATTVSVMFDEPQLGLTEGQQCAFYEADGDACLGGGPIETLGPMVLS
ncbi:tRNA-specific 2-thiouridylase [Zopfochytrium polystomum]|nr:tRNA-specific 2-thiouridylase [Zopfochytrium polystomum]